MTFCATVNAIIHTGALPILADVDAVAMNIDQAQVEAKITSITKAFCRFPSQVVPGIWMRFARWLAVTTY
ncbi:DegT/DnrJ/EryC1/StrS family aminotransferase [Microcoleus vaginatus ZQ-A3]